MRAMNRWTVEVTIGEDDGRTYAEATLHDDVGNHIVGTGRAKLDPTDTDIPEIGDEIAAARALTDLGHRLLRVAADDVATVTGDRVVLHH